MAKGEKIIGIDLGTTNSVVAVMEGSDAKVIPNPEGNRLTPSVVAFTDKGDTLVGEPARRKPSRIPSERFTRSSGLWAAGHAEVASEEKIVPYQIVGGARRLREGQDRGQGIHPDGNLGAILRKLKESAETYLGHKVNKAVITVPAYFNDARAGHEGRRPDRRAGSRPYHQRADGRGTGLRSRQERIRKDLRLRLGRRHVRRLRPGRRQGVFHVKSTNGDTHLGGDDFDHVLINYVAGEFQKEHGIDLRKDTMALQRLQEACEKAKKELSSSSSTDVNLPFITADASGPSTCR